jgi:hypothetical protein
MDKFQSGIYEGSVGIGKLKYLSYVIGLSIVGIILIICAINMYITSINTVNVDGNALSSNCQTTTNIVYNTPSGTLVTDYKCSNLIEYTRDNILKNVTITESINRATNSQVDLTYDKRTQDEPKVKGFVIEWYWFILISIICFIGAYFNYYILSNKEYNAAVGVVGAFDIGNKTRDLIFGRK